MASTTFDASNSAVLAEITSDNTKVSNANDNLMYDLSLLDADWWNAQTDANGGDIRITDDTGTKFGTETAYSFELENFANNGDGTGTGIIFFDSSHLETGTDKTWRIYCGDTSLSLPANTATLGRNNVWNANYSAVYHLAEDPSGTAPQMVDSTGNGNDGTSEGSMTSGDLVDGNIGKALEFDGSNDVIDIGNQIDNTFDGDFTMMVWAKMGNTTQGSTFVDHDRTVAYVGHENAGSNGFEFRLFDEDTNPNITSGVSNTNWNHLVGTLSGSNMEFFLNGTSQGTDTTDGGILESDQGTAIGGSDNQAQLMTGQISEVRVLSTALSSAWISTEYNNQFSPSTFWTTGATETGGTTVSVNTVSAAFSTPTVTATGAANVSVNTVSAIFSTPSITVVIPSTVSVNAVTAQFSLPAVTVRAGIDVDANTVSATFSALSATATGSALVSPNTVAATFSTPTVSVQAAVRQTVDPVTATFTALTVTRAGPLWTRVPAANDGGQWTRIARDP